MAELIASLESWVMSLGFEGYTLEAESTQGAVLYSLRGKPSYRIASYEPNQATLAWMKREHVIDCRCLPTGKEGPRTDIPEFGLGPSDDYHSDTSAVSKSMLSVFMESPVEYYHQFITGLMPRKTPTAQMKLGTICHAMLLEKKRLDEACIAYPLSCYSSGERPRLLTDRAEAFARSVKPLIAVRESVLPVIQTIIANAMKSPLAELFKLNAKFETRVDAELYGVKCKCKPDMHIVLSDQVIVPDLKFGAFKPEDWVRSSTRFSYWLQQAHYTAILEKEYGLPVSWSFWAFESVFPYRVGPKTYGRRSIEISRDKHRELLQELKRCQDSGVWEDRFQTEIELKPWDLTQRGEQESSEESTDESEGTEYESTDVEF